MIKTAFTLTFFLLLQTLQAETQREVEHYNSLRKELQTITEEIGENQVRLVCGVEARTNEANLRNCKRCIEENNYAEASRLLAETINSLKKNQKASKIHKGSDGLIKMGEVLLNPLKSEVYLSARLTETKDFGADSQTVEDFPKLGEMPFEVILTNQHGRVYEALFITEARPFHLQTMLIMAGFRNGSEPETLDVQVEYFDKKQKKLTTIPIEHFMVSEKTRKTMKKDGWKFIGSSIKNRTFVADWVGELMVKGEGESILVPVNNDIRDNRNTFILNKKIQVAPGSKLRLIFKKKINPVF